jgi:hypothetical protein
MKTLAYTWSSRSHEKSNNMNLHTSEPYTPLRSVASLLLASSSANPQKLAKKDEKKKTKPQLTKFSVPSPNPPTTQKRGEAD